MVVATLGQANFVIGRETHANAIETKNNVVDIKGIARAQEFRKVLTWISLLDFRAVQESAPKQPVAGTGRCDEEVR